MTWFHLIWIISIIMVIMIMMKIAIISSLRECK